MNEANIISEIRQYIKTHILAEDVEIGSETILQDAGLDSFSTVEIILFIERQYGLVIPDDMMVPENFKTLKALAATVEGLNTKAAI